MDDEQLTPYGAAIRRARLRKGWDQETLGRALGKDKGWVSREEGGRPNLPDVGLYRTLCEVLDLPLRDLLEAKGYLEPEEHEPGVAYVIREDDPRVKVLRLLEGKPEYKILGAVELIRVADVFSGDAVDLGGEDHQAGTG